MHDARHDPIERMLVRQELLGCDGRTSHVLVVELDGQVRVTDAAGHVVRVDPRSRAQVPATPVLTRTLVDSACSLAREVGSA
jgi:hypothetical protein